MFAQQRRRFHQRCTDRSPAVEHRQECVLRQSKPEKAARNLVFDQIRNRVPILPHRKAQTVVEFQTSLAEFECLFVKHMKVGGRRSEIGSWRSEVGSLKSKLELPTSDLQIPNYSLPPSQA